MSLTRADVIAYLERLGAQELDEFITEFQERLRLEPPVSPHRVVMGAAPTMGMPIHELEYRVELLGFGDHKVTVIKAVRELWPLGLLEAKRLVESAPVVLRVDQSRREAEDIADALRRGGAEIKISPQ